MQTLNVIGCGHVGQTLARLWTGNAVFEVRGVLNRSQSSGERAIDFVGSGTVVDDFDQLEPTDLVMISARDDAIETCCQALCQSGTLREGAIVFRCSGSLPSTLLAAAREHGARIASVHPVKSFADSARAADTFAGTFCAVEGDAEACAVLRDALQACGANTFDVRPEAKTIYHAGTVFSCNYLVALLELGLRCFEQAGVPREAAAEILCPIVQGTVDNVLSLGPARALTGPIARGEVPVVERQIEALGAWDETVERAYRMLGRVAAELSAAKGEADAESLGVIRELLRG